MDTKQFILENDIMNKMRAALEQIAVGQGYTVFEGLETGTCNVGIVYDGNNISFHKLERLKPEEISIPDKVSEPVATTAAEESQPLPGVPEPTPETEKTKRRTKGFRDHNMPGDATP